MWVVAVSNSAVREEWREYPYNTFSQVVSRKLGLTALTTLLVTNRADNHVTLAFSRKCGAPLLPVSDFGRGYLILSR
jgi:hypothetical protein